MIEVQGLTRRFGTKVAVHPLDVTISPGGITGLLGPNGAGKSTFMRMLLGLVRPNAGRVRIAGVELAGDGKAIRDRATYAPGELALYGELKARAHLRWFLRGRGREALQRSLRIAEDLDLPLQRRVHGFSHGMKRMLMVAAAMGPRVPVRILDEPTEGLDPTRRAQVLELFERDANDGTTLLLSSHHLGELDHSAERMLFLREGRLFDEDASRELRERSRRCLRIRWASPVDETAVRDAFFVGDPGTRVRVDGDTATVVLAGGADPRPLLQRIALASSLPAPASLTFGELSLQELYRELYGKEGV